ncbi:MAG: hypothetical protein AB7Y46_12180 [Armatimonadota bacterium]
MSGGRAPVSHVLVGPALAAAIGLAATAWGVFSPAVLEFYADSPDSVGIARWAERATAQDMLRWWTGTWIQADSYYYRPLASFLFWLECRLFGYDFQGHVVISWLLHGAVCVCVYMLALRLFPRRHALSPATALLAVALVNVRLGPSGPHWQEAPVAYSVVAWWPAQTDQASLLLSLLALLALDRWLQGEDRRGLATASVLWVAAVLFKEMALILPAIIGILLVMRRGWGALRLLSRAEHGALRIAPGLAWRVVLPPIVAAAVFLAARPLIVPGAWAGVESPARGYLLKVVFLLFARPFTILVSHGAWLPLTAAFIALGTYLWLRLPRRPSVVWLTLALVLGSGAIAQLVGGNFALLTIPTQLGALGTVTLLALGLLALAHVRAGWVWGLLGMALVVHVPLISVWGPHYFYWPAAFWALFNAGLWHWVIVGAGEQGLIGGRATVDSMEAPIIT